MKYFFKITVAGHGDFPIDMLRYSQCYPSDVESVDAISNDEWANDVDYRRTKRTVTVSLDNQSMGMALNCVQRFASFGWIGTITQEERV